MKLSDWLSSNEIKDADFADRIGVSRQALHRYKTGKRVPERDVMFRIVSETDGSVTANDFYEGQAA